MTVTVLGRDGMPPTALILITNVRSIESDGTHLWIAQDTETPTIRRWPVALTHVAELQLSEP